MHKKGDITMSLILRIFVCLASLALIAIVLRDLIRRKLTERQSLFWLVVAVILFIAGVLPDLAALLAKAFDVVNPPNIIFAIALLAALFGIYSCNRTNADLTRRVNELSIQISILNSDIKASEPHAVPAKDNKG